MLPTGVSRWQVLSLWPPSRGRPSAHSPTCRGTSGTLASLDCQLMAVMQPSGGNQHASLGAVYRAEYPQTLKLLQLPLTAWDWGEQMQGIIPEGEGIRLQYYEPD